MSSQNGFEASHQRQNPGAEQSIDGNCQIIAEVGWYILGEDQHHVGPYALSELREHFLNGYLSESTLVWYEGRSEWQPLSSIPGAVTGISQQEADDSTILSANDDDEFEKWQKEIREAEAAAESEGLKDEMPFGDSGADLRDFDSDRLSTPPDGEEEFTDDDGTTYKWDRNLRAWVPQDNTSSRSDLYGVADMTFLEEDEIFPTLEVSDAPTKEEVTGAVSNATVNASDASGKEEVNGTRELVEAKQNGKRKLSVKQDDKKEANKPPDSWFDLKVNTHVYVTGRPEDVTIDEADENLCLELEADVEEECKKLGPVDSVRVCENHPQGVVLVRFKDREDAQKCIELMNGRWFGGRQIHASEDDGAVNHALVRDLDYDSARLDQFGAELEAD